MGKIVLFSPIGGTDPMSEYNEHDGALIHICRHYVPDIVCMYMSKEIIENEEKDHRCTYCLNKLGERLGHHFDIHKIERPDLENVQKFELIYKDFDEILTKITEELNKDDLLLLNISSGTPAMKSALLVIATMVDIPCKCLQVSTPAKSMNQHIHDKKGGFNPEIRWEMNPDNEPGAEKRVTEEKLISLKRLKYEEIIKQEISSFNYAAAVKLAEEMRTDFACDYIEKLKLAAAREQMDFRTVDAQLKKIGKEKYEKIYSPIRKDKYRLIYEYTLALQVTANRGEYSDFIRRMTPLVIKIFEGILEKQCGFKLDQYTVIRHNRIKEWDNEKLQKQSMDGKSYFDILNEHYNKEFKGGWVKSDHFNVLIKALIPNRDIVDCVETLRKIEVMVRNIAAHEMKPISEEYIQSETRSISSSGKGYTCNEIIKLIKQALSYTSCDISRDDWNSYEKMNQDIIESI